VELLWWKRGTSGVHFDWIAPQDEGTDEGRTEDEWLQEEEENDALRRARNLLAENTPEKEWKEIGKPAAEFFRLDTSPNSTAENEGEGEKHPSGSRSETEEQGEGQEESAEEKDAAERIGEEEAEGAMGKGCANEEDCGEISLRSGGHAEEKTEGAAEEQAEANEAPEEVGEEWAEWIAGEEIIKVLRREDGKDGEKLLWVKREGAAPEVMERRAAWLVPAAGGAFKAKPVPKKKSKGEAAAEEHTQEKKQRKNVGVEAVSKEERVHIAVTKADEKEAEELLKKAKKGAKPNVTLASAWKDEKGRWYAVTQRGAVYRSSTGEAWGNIQERHTPLGVSEAAEIARSGVTTTAAREQGQRIMAQEREKAGARIGAAWRRRQRKERLSRCEWFFAGENEAEASTARLRYEVFTDGSGKDQKKGEDRGGWGVWEIAAEGEWQTAVSRGGPVGEAGTNNRAEIRAIREACRDLAGRVQSEEKGALAVIRFNSLFAAMSVTGKQEVKEKELREELEEAQEALLELQEKIEIRFMHVKAHSGNEGNNGADEAAEKGKAGIFRDEKRRARKWEKLAEWDQAELKAMKGQQGEEEEKKTASEKGEKPCKRIAEVKALKEEERRKEEREVDEERKQKKKKRSEAWKKVDGALWNCNGVEGKEADVATAMDGQKLSFVVLV